MTLILVPSFSFKELDWLVEHNKEDKLWNSGAYGAVNLRPDGAYSYLNNTVSISTGRRALGVKDWNGFEKGEEINEQPVENLFFQRHGFELSTQIIHPSLHLLSTKNEQGSFRAHIGWFGELLKQENVDAFVLGNADTADERVRYGSLLVMDKSGGAQGSLFDTVDKSSTAPAGLKMNKDKLVDQLINIQKKSTSSFTVVEWGDIHRLYSEKEKIAPQYYKIVYRETLTHLEKTIKDIVDKSKGEVWFLSPKVNSESYNRKDQLGPLWLWKSSEEGQYALYSATTRRESLISNLDLVDSWLESLNIDRNLSLGMGQALERREISKGSYEQFQKQIEKINVVYKNRGKVLSSYVTSLVVLLITVSLLIFIFKEKEKWLSLASLLLLSAVLSPLLFLVTSALISFFPSMTYAFLILLLSVIGAYLLKKWSSFPFSHACALFTVVMTIDIVTGGHLIAGSFLGYDPVIGARYYGIGNEFAGVYISSAILMLSPYIKLSKGKTFILLNGVLLFLLVMLGASSFGANAGASLSAVLIFLFVIFQLYVKKINLFKKIILAASIIFLMLGLLYLLQMSQPSSHITIAFQQVMDGNFQVIMDTIKRKLQMNWKIFKVSYWTQLFVTSYLLLGLTLWRGRKEKLSGEQALLINCAIVGSIALLLLNDSGIVAAATSMFITVSVYYGWKMNMVGSKQE